MKKVLNICFLVIWMLVIFLLSNQESTKSQSLSDGLIKDSLVAVEKITGRDIPDERKNEIIISASDIVRSTAHFVEYLILGVLVINVLKDYYKLNYKILLIGIGFCILSAIGDEIHQLFVSGRALQIIDICIDTIGSSIGGYIFFKLKKDK